MKKLSYILTFIVLSSCSSYMHILEVKSDTGSIVDDVYFFENDTLSIAYSFWDEKGVVAFRIENKTNKPFYIDWKKSAFIYSGINNSYWEDTELRTSQSISISEGRALYFNDIRFNKGFTVSSSSTMISRPSRISSIAPNSGILKANYLITPTYHLSLYNHKSEEFPSIKKRGETATIYISEFDKDNSPITFQNFLVISFNEDFSNEIYLQHSFYISKITEIEKDEAIILVKDAEPPIEINRFKKHSAFYNVVKQSQSVKAQ